ncbi:MAG: PCRF domain-containing protein, partial [Pseudomonadota bacterium]|nr:PCRF domain-containing protein [Pseudomonadota bacterium]
MTPSIQKKLADLGDRLDEINLLLSQETATENLDSYRRLTKEHADISPLVLLYRSYLEKQNDLITAQGMLHDPDLREYAETEIALLETSLNHLEHDLQIALLPKDPDDEHNLFLEIRAGTGGEESALFASDLLRMYTRFAERQHWSTELISESPSDLGGYKEVIVRIIGPCAYSRLKFESGGHRVQRVPATETQGRIHTSACTVAAMPEPDEAEEIHINPTDLRIDTFRASGAG